MTATVLAFPTLAERDDREFVRYGTSTFIRALDEAPALWEAMRLSVDRSVLRGRVTAFASLVARLATRRPEMVEHRVELPGGMEVELGDVPGLVAAMLNEG